MSEELMLLVAGPLLAIAMISYVLSYFVALRSRPSVRAAWTTGIAFLIVSFTLMFGVYPGFEVSGPFAAVPSALIVFWYWRSEFRDAWIENPEMAPDGLTLANDDWRLGILILLAAVVIAVARGLIRIISGA